MTESCADQEACLRRAAAHLAAPLLGLLTIAAFPGFAAALPPSKALAPAKPPSFARSCTITSPDLHPLFGAPSSAQEDADSAESDSDDDDEDDEDEDDDSVPGLVLPGSATCLSVSGTVSAGLQYDAFRISRSGVPAPPNATSFQTSASIRIATAHDLASGLRVGTAFTMTMRTPEDDSGPSSIDEATVLVGPWTFGLDTSRFSFWTGDEFIFSSRVPSRTVGLIAWELSLTESWVATLAIEDPTLTTVSTVPVLRGRVPDGVARLVYQSGGWTVHGAVALRDVPRPGGQLGRAGILGVTYEAQMLGRPGSVTGQIAGAIDAAPYIGSQLDATIANRVLLGTDPTRGFSGVVSTHREWTDTIATNVYVSRYQLSLPLADQSKGKLRIDRAAANLVWTPVDGFKAGIEASVAHARISLTGRAVPAGLAGRQISTQVFVERSF